MFDIVNKFNNKRTYIILTLFYFLIHLLSLLNHEHWLDEAQAWVIAKNLSLFDVIRILPTEGHPCLWFLFIMPFAKLGLSFYHFSYITLILMTITVYLFLSRSPLHIITKCIALLSSMFLYFNPVVARTYSLIAFIVILICIAYKDRLNHPILYGLLVSLLFQTHVIVFGLAIGLFVDLLIEYIKDKKNRKLLISLIIILGSFILMVLEIMPRSSLPSGIDTSGAGMLSKLKLETILKNLSYFAYTSWGWQSRSTAFIPYLLFVFCIIGIFVFITKNKSWKANINIIIIAILSIGEFFAVLLLVYPPHSQMASVLVMIILFLMWQLYDFNDFKNIRVITSIMLVLISLFTGIVCQSVLRTDLKGYYSSSEYIAKYIENNLKENGVVIIENNNPDSTVYAYVNSNRKDISFIDARTNELFVFHQLGLQYNAISTDSILDVADRIESEKDLFYLSNRLIDNKRLKLVCSSSEISSSWNEEYYLYRIEG